MTDQYLMFEGDGTTPSMNQLEIRIRIYQICYTAPAFDEVANTEVTLLPNARCEGVWDQYVLCMLISECLLTLRRRLVFDHDIKGPLIRMIENARKRFSSFSCYKRDKQKFDDRGTKIIRISF